MLIHDPAKPTDEKTQRCVQKINSEITKEE